MLLLLCAALGIMTGIPDLSWSPKFYVSVALRQHIGSCSSQFQPKTTLIQGPERLEIVDLDLFCNPKPSMKLNKLAHWPTFTLGQKRKNTPTDPQGMCVCSSQTGSVSFFLGDKQTANLGELQMATLRWYFLDPG